MMMFESREEAGRRLADWLISRGVTADLVLGLPRGGVLVAAPVAERLGVPLDAWVVRKIGHPSNPEFAVGALAEPDVLWLDPVVGELDPALHRELVRVVKEEQGRLELYRERLHPHGLPALRHRRVVLVDDGFATGATAHAAVLAVRKQDAEEVIAAAPVAAPEAVERLARAADQVHVLWSDPNFVAVGQYYRSFEPPGEAEVLELLQRLGDR
jgi:putative phosphoribosyl transferase